eukprot:scaffold227273_cov28-Tisochrysis_lutea.AAC.2
MASQYGRWHKARGASGSPDQRRAPPSPTPSDGSLGIVTELAPRASLFHFLHPGGVITGDPPAVPLAWRFLQGAAAGMVRMR